MSLFALKRRAMTPVVWRRRRAQSGRNEVEHRHLARSGYSRAAALLLDTTGVDPKYLHRADLDSDSVVVDVGAASGEETAEFVELYDPTVFAFEPAPDTFPFLESRFADNPKVHVFPYGLGASDATLTMELAGHGSSVYGSNRGTFPTAEVQVRDVAGVIAELGLERIDLMKINIEGGEFDLLDRLVATGLLQRIRYLLVQFHEWHPRAYLRRPLLRRAFRRTHDEVWNYPWCWELWCDRTEPPPPSEYTPEELAAIQAEIRRQVAEGAWSAE